MQRVRVMRTGSILWKYALINAMRAVFANPSERNTVRGLAKKAGISPSAAKKAVDELASKRMIKIGSVGRAFQFYANLESALVRQWKVVFSLERLQEAGLAEAIIRQDRKALSLVIYGSVALGTDDEKSDLDLLLVTSEKNRFSLREIEADLKREINLMVQTPQEWRKKAESDKVFYDHVIIDSVVLYGKKPVVL